MEEIQSDMLYFFFQNRPQKANSFVNGSWSWDKNQRNFLSRNRI